MNGEVTLIIAIDGPAGSGKSTTAMLVASNLGIAHLDTGSMYRAITVHFIDNKYDVNTVDLQKAMNSIKLEVLNSSGKYSILLNGKDITNRLRDNQVSSMVSSISSQKIIREKMVSIQRDLSKDKSIVMDGRDIGTVVFPNANFKFFLTASIENRSLRRYKELNKSIDLKIIEKEIIERDHLDSTRLHSPLKKASDAIIIDTTHLTISEQVSMILEIINN